MCVLGTFWTNQSCRACCYSQNGSRREEDNRREKQARRRRNEEASRRAKNQRKGKYSSKFSYMHIVYQYLYVISHTIQWCQSLMPNLWYVSLCELCVFWMNYTCFDAETVIVGWGANVCEEISQKHERFNIPYASKPRLFLWSCRTWGKQCKKAKRKFCLCA